MNLRTANRDRHGECSAISLQITRTFMPTAIGPEDVIGVLSWARVRFALVGAYGLAGWTEEPRATLDVDVLVAARQHKKAVTALLTRYPDLMAEAHDVVTRLRDPETGRVVIDVMRPNQPLFQAALKHTHRVQAAGRSYLIPDLEMALAMKFAAMVSPNRADEKKYQDAADFIRMVKRNPVIDLPKLSELGELVYAGGGNEIVEMVRRVRAGERLDL
jgi:hypothetical protein